MGRGNEDRSASFETYFIDESLQLGGKEVIGSLAGSFQFLVVMSEFDEHVVAWFHLRESFLQASCLDEGIGTFATFGIVGKTYAVVEESGNHLSPTCPRFVVLVYYGRISGKENCRDIVCPFYFYVCYARGAAIKFQREFVIPVQLVFFA